MHDGSSDKDDNGKLYGDEEIDYEQYYNHFN